MYKTTLVRALQPASVLLVVWEVKLSSAKCPQVVCLLVVGGGCTLESAGPHQWPLT